MSDEARLRVIVYDAASGRIGHVNGNVPASLVAAQAGPGQVAMVEPVGAPADYADFYAPGGLLRPRPALVFDKLEILADGEDVAVLVLPGPFRAIVEGVVHDVEDRLEIASTMPGTYRVVIEDVFPWLDLDLEITAT